MTTNQYIAKLKRQAENMKNITAPLQIASYSVTAQMGERIFDDGRTTEGTIIGKYDTEPIYISLSAVPKPKGAPTGKPSGKTKTKRITELQSRLDEFGDEVKTGPATRRVTIGTQVVAVGGKSKFKDGTPHKSKYFPTGYKGYRENVGRQTGKVDLSMTGEMRLDFGNDKKMAEPRKVSEFEYQIRFDKDIDVKKREGLEQKYGEIFTLSQEERDLFYRVVQFEFQSRLSPK